MTEGVRRTGVCKWFNIVKGYGFITPHDNSPDVFLHQTVIRMKGFRSLAEGEEVEYEVVHGKRGIEASMVCGPGGTECRGSDRRPVSKKRSMNVRCYNCGMFSIHIAAECPKGPLPKRCHCCGSEDHLIAECPHKDFGGGKGGDEERGGHGGEGENVELRGECSKSGDGEDLCEKSESKDKNNNNTKAPGKGPKQAPSRTKS